MFEWSCQEQTSQATGLIYQQERWMLEQSHDYLAEK
jgi:hypothetical protein